MSETITIYIRGMALMVFKEIALIHEVTHGQSVPEEHGHKILIANCEYGIMQCEMKLGKKKIKIPSMLVQEQS